ncbi:MAG: cbb3-type cytochrome c oxidase subunit I [Actinobacteria bacterium]|nr:cbb3-type cytochrome c oxidase subunit I [Thermoleophilia bacterium]MCB9011419.1 cbb3-type cytochrome c oxidase subunit I [Actinomycetota bacterium]
MSFRETLLHGTGKAFHPSSLTTMQKLVLRFVILGLVFYGFAAIEGMIMRIYAIEPVPLIDTKHYFGMLTVHPLVGIFGSTYLIVMGAFLFVVPLLMNKPLWNLRLAHWNLWLIVVGTFTFWLDGFITHYAPLYTLYWPLPADFTQYHPLGGAIFITGIALVMLGTACFITNIFATIVYRPAAATEPVASGGVAIRSALGITGVANLFRSRERRAEHAVSLPVAAIARGTVDMAFNTIIILFTGVLILVFMVADLIGRSLANTSVDALLYKNWFWWGLDLIADGLVLIFVAGTWYLIATMITGKPLFMQNIARAALLVELVVSWTVWSHHLLSDQAQPVMLKIVSGELVTAFELVTQGLAFFITLATLWSARPLKMTNELKFLLGGLLGFGLAVPAGIIQADIGLNRILHNTQWIVGPHVHVAILVGLTMTLYSAIYLLLPTLTNGATLYSQKLANFHFWAHLVGGVGMGAFMGMAGLQGMLRRTIYTGDEFLPYMILAGVCGALLIAAFAAFLFNIVMTVGLRGAIGIFRPSKLDSTLLLPAAPAPAPAARTAH